MSQWLEERGSKMRMNIRPLAAIWLLAFAHPSTAQLAGSENGRDILTIDHYVLQEARVPSIEGQHTQLYVRERARASTVARPTRLEGRVALFVHGAGTPAEVAFDVHYPGYSWMAHLAEAGFDVFSVDMTGYGRSTRPHVMNNPCNLSEAAQHELGIGITLGECEPSYLTATTTIASDWADIDRVVDYIRSLRGVERVSLLGWSLGGPRAGGYAARHPDKVERLVLLAPAYAASSPSAPPDVTSEGAAMTSQSLANFTANWDRQVGCENQYDPAVSAAVWEEMLKSDPVGATWGPGIRRAPRTTVWGWNESAVRGTMTPMLIVAGVHDGQVSPDRVEALYEDLGAEDKVFIDLGCASHNAMWETNRLLLFNASLEWLRDGTVNGESHGVFRMGYR
jgi:pimeloyl-ACP methyl ester carboxylesterase